MARRRGVDAQIQVTRGFVTEFTPLAFPREAAIDVDNCIIDPDGSVRRRPGIDLEQQYQLNTVPGGSLVAAAVSEITFTTHLWESVSNSGTLNIVVQQVGASIMFFAQFGAISAQLIGTLDLTTHAIDLAKLRREPIQVASGLGNLYMVNTYMRPLRVSYDGISFTAEEIDIRIRDFDGLGDGLAIDERPTTLFRNHYYNLRNQGWTDVNINKFAGLPTATDLCAGTGNVGGQPAGSNGDFPSNADAMTVGIVTDGSGNLVFDHTFIRGDSFGNTPTAKGHFILDAFFKDYDAALGCVGTGSAIFPTRPEAVAFHQGRVFYTSAVVQNAISGVYYSRQLVAIGLENECFQEADPTAAEINDLVATDGGFLPMPGVGQIYALKEMSNGIAAVASNGVWFITGADQGSGLSATNIRLDKVSKIGALSARTLVEAEDSLFYFGIDGIIQLQPNENGSLTAVNITNANIQSFYINIGADSRRDASAVYIPEERKIYWAYREVQEASSPTVRTYNKFLILDFDIKGFYKYSINEDASQNFPELVGLSLVKPLTASAGEVPLLELDGSIVTELDGSPITESLTQENGQITQLKAATLVYSTVDAEYKVSFSTFHSRSFTDWLDASVDGVGIPMDSYIEFAEFNMAAPHTKGTPNYVHSFFQQTSKNLQTGGYYELPPLYYNSTGMRMSQSVLEVLNKPSANLRASQSILEVLTVAPSDFRVSQSLVEVLTSPPSDLRVSQSVHEVLHIL